MKLNTANHHRARLFLALAVVASGAANAGTNSDLRMLATAAQGAPATWTAHQTTTITDLSQQPVIGLLMGAVFNDGSTGTPGVFDAGETIDYTFTVLNLGNVELDYVTVSDDLGVSISCPGDTLAVGDSMVCTGTYTIPTNGLSTIADSGHVEGMIPDVTTATASDSVMRTATSGSEIRAFKSPLLAADNDHDGQASAGDTLAYTFAVKNSGNTVLDPVMLTEPDPSRIDGAISCANKTVAGAPFAGLGLPPGSGGALAAGDTILCTATYTIQPADVTAGVVRNQANVSGQPPFGGVASGSAASAFKVPPAASTPATVAVPVDDWRALLLLGLGLLAAVRTSARRRRRAG